MASCFACGCCAACRPRYKRLVDSIYPTDPTQGLVKANMQKLTFYAISHPEKLDRIGNYLHSRLSRDVYRQRVGLVRVAAEAMDQLLAACHGSPSLNLFVESFLKMVQKLLETADPGLEVMATKSFVNFSNIEEDTPSYHRRYDFFISKFSALCHSNHSNLAIRQRLRTSGLKGLRGVVRKTVSDDLQANIWEKQHMEKIVPSVLYNMHDKCNMEERKEEVGKASLTDSAGGSDSTDALVESPKTLADTCLRELIGKASFGSMKSVIQPILRHCDNHGLWVPPEFCVACFRAIMYSIQAQYSYVVIQALIGHLDQHANSRADIRIGMATVLSEIVLIAATSIGPSLLEIFNSLLRHLRSSVEYQLKDVCPSVDAEKRYQETLINTMGDFANSLPDYQKVEIMMFIIGKVPSVTVDKLKHSDTFLQHVLVKTLLKVATKYRTGYFGTAMTSTFLDPLLRLALVEDAGVRLLTQRIIHTLLDRHQNLSTLEHLPFVADVGELQLTVEKCSRNDQMFMKKNGYSLLSTLYWGAIAPDENPRENYDAILCTMALLCVEVGCDDVLMELYRVAIALQTAALDPTIPLELKDRVEIENLVAKYLNLSSQLLSIPALCQHVQQVITHRAQNAHTALNIHESITTYDNLESIDDMGLTDDSFLFDKNVISEALKASAKDTTRLALPFVPKATSDALTAGTGSPQTVPDGRSVSLDMVSVDSSPDQSHLASRRNTIFGLKPEEQPLTVERLREIMNGPPENEDKREMEMTKEIVETFRNRPFDELVDLVKEQKRNVPDNVAKILQKVKEREASCSEGVTQKPKNIFELDLPELFVY